MTVFPTNKRHEVLTTNLGTFTWRQYESRHTDDGFGMRRVPVATRTAEVSVVVDYSKLWRYAQRALASRSGKSTLADGAIQFLVDRSTLRETRSGDVSKTDR